MGFRIIEISDLSSYHVLPLENDPMIMKTSWSRSMIKDGCGTTTCEWFNSSPKLHNLKLCVVGESTIIVNLWCYKIWRSWLIVGLELESYLILLPISAIYPCLWSGLQIRHNPPVVLKPTITHMTAVCYMRRSTPSISWLDDYWGFSPWAYTFPSELWSLLTIHST
jgi:hypothetical protein